MAKKHDAEQPDKSTQAEGQETTPLDNPPVQIPEVVYATDLLHEDGVLYAKGAPVTVATMERAARLCEIGICTREEPKPAGPSPEQDADYQDKMLRLGRG